MKTIAQNWEKCQLTDCLLQSPCLLDPQKPCLIPLSRASSMDIALGTDSLRAEVETL